MGAAWLLILALLPVPWMLDALFRVLWGLAARRQWIVLGAPVGRVLALVPARNEGSAVRPTLESLVKAAEGQEAKVVLLLDGPDPQARGVAEALGVRVVEKPTPGPHKAAALRYAAQTLAEEILAADAVAIFDVGSVVAADFFRQLRFPDGVAAVQAKLAGHGTGPGEAAGLSEALAQDVWDRGKQNLGWSVKLRGTGTVFRSRVFLELASKLETQIEDTEASLLLQAAGGKAVLLEGAVVQDEKPKCVEEASRQRARWLAGQAHLLWRHRGTLLKLLAKSPLQGLAWVAGLLSRPLSLSVPLRFLVGAALALLSWRRSEQLLAGWGFVVAASAAAEAGWLVARHPRVVAPAIHLAWAWVKAVATFPQGAKRWLRGRGRGR
jgi:hypothetical protein